MKKIFLMLTIQSLSLFASSDQVGELFVVPVCPTHGFRHLQQVADLVKNYQIGSVIFMKSDSETQRETLHFLKTQANPSLLTFQDVETGIGMRCEDIPPFPKQLTLGAIEDLELLKEFGRQVARQCQAVGIQGALTPVADLHADSRNPIGMRSFGQDPQAVSKKSVAVMQGIQEEGVFACAKHFPGHGHTQVDSHLALPVIKKSLKELTSSDLLPFQALIDEGVEFVMTGHLFFPNIDQSPSSLSEKITTNILREQMGFNGYIITDALNMRALQQDSLEKIAAQALLAGADFLLFATSRVTECTQLLEIEIPKVIAYIKKVIPKELLEEKIQRVLALKARISQKEGEVKALQSQEFRRTLYRHAVTQVGPKIPMPSKVALIQERSDPDLEKLLGAHCSYTPFSFEEIEQAEEYPVCLVSITSSKLPTYLPQNSLVLLFAAPYLLENLSMSSAVIGYENVLEAKEAVVDVLFDKLTPLGKLPIQLSNGKKGEEYEPQLFEKRKL